MVIPDDGGSSIPPLPENAGPNETLLREIYWFSTPLVRMSAEDWGKTSDSVSVLAAQVRSVVSALKGADEPWEGPAADSAYSTLHSLAKSLDTRSAELDDIKKGLEDAAEAADAARLRYATDVRGVDIDPESWSPEGGGNFNVTGYEAAMAQRESKAADVLGDFGVAMNQAAKKMPVEAQDDSVTIDPTGGGGTPPSSNPPGGGGGGGGGGYTPPTGTPTWPPTPTPPVDPTPQPWPPVDQTPDPDPLPPVVDEPDPPTWDDPHLDGPTTGTTSPTGPGSPTWAGTTPSGSSGAGGLGGGAGMAGAGGLLAGGGALLGRGALGRGGVPTGGGGRPLVAGSTGSTGRGSTGAGGRGGAAGSGRPVVAPGQQGQARGGRGGAGGVRGATKGGRYGVPKLGGSGRGGAAAGAFGSGGRGGRRKDGTPEDVDALTHEDEETWFEGEDDATPPVWR